MLEMMFRHFNNGYDCGYADAMKKLVWISVKDRLPETIPCGAGTAYSEAVIVWTDGRKAMMALISYVRWIFGMRGERKSPIGCPCPNRQKDEFKIKKEVLL